MRHRDAPKERPHYEGGADEASVFWVLGEGVEQRVPREAYERSAEPRVPEFVLAAFRDQARALAASAAEAIDWARIQPKLLQQAMPFQREGIERGIRLGGRVLLADEMGLGKTIQALGILAYFTSSALARAAAAAPPGSAALGGAARQQSLVICPASLCAHWANEIAKWTSLRPHVVKNDKQPLPAAADIVIVSYNLIGTAKHQKWRELAGSAGAPGAAAPRQWECVVCDESHAFRSRDTQRTTSLTNLLTKQCRRLVLISGTPQVARPEQLFAQLNFLLYPTSISWSAYTTRWCNGHFNAFGQWDTSGASCTGELARLLSLRMVRRLAEDVVTSLPPLSRTRVELTLPEADTAKYRELHAAFTKALETMQALSNKAKASKSNADFQAARKALFDVKNLKMQLYRETGTAKAAGAIDYVRRVHAAALPRATIVFFHHQAVLERLRAAFPEAVVVDGGTKTEERQGIIDAVASGRKTLALLSIGACCTGLNCTPGVTEVVFVELSFTPSELRQAEKRPHRIGAVHPVSAHYLIARSTLDANILEMNLGKFFVTNETMADKRSRFDFDKSAFNVPLSRMGINRFAGMVQAQPLEDESQEAYIRRAGVCLEREDAMELLHTLEPATEAMHELSAAAAGHWLNLCERQGAHEFAEAWLVTDLAPEVVASIQEEPLSAVRLEMLEREDARVCACFIKQNQ